MSTPLPAYDPALPDTNFGYSYEYGVDVFIPAAIDGGTGIWQPVRRATAIDPQASPKTQDAATYDDRGSDNAPKVGENWTLSLGVQVQRHPTSGLYLPEVERLLELTDPETVGTQAIGRFRWYDKPRAGEPNPADAYEGVGSVSVNRGQTGNDGIGQWSVTITGQGARKRIENPFTGWATEDTTP